jgi:hypothetical protein
MIFIFLWVLFSILVGVVASKYGKGGALWTVVPLIISPLVALIVLVVMLLPGSGKKQHRQLRSP